MLQATCRLVQSPPSRVLLLIAYPDIYQCADHVPDVLAHKPIGLEGVDDLLVEYTRRRGINSEGLALLPEGGGWLLAEFGAATVAEAEAQASGLMEQLGQGPNPPQMRLFTDQKQIKRVWEVRESSLGVISYVPGEDLTWEGWEDSAVAPEKLGKYLRDLRKLMNSFDYRGTLYGHFGDGCVHNRIELRSGIEGGHRQVPQIHGRGRRSRGQLRRINLRRAWRRASAGRTAAQNVRAGIAAGLPRIQSHLGPSLEDESGQGN